MYSPLVGGVAEYRQKNSEPKRTQMSRREIIPYDPKLKELSRRLRKQRTLSEVLLWNQLKQKQMRGLQFLRQRPIVRYSVDFFCYELMLAIEIDGESHNLEKQVKQDPIRQKRLETLDVRLLRFTDREVKQNMNGVLQSIERWIDEFENSRRIQEHPPSPPQGRNNEE